MRDAELPEVPEGAEAMSLLGRPLLRPDPADRERLEEQLEAARIDYAASPESIDAAVWVGRRLGYLGRFRDAIAWYSDAIERHGGHPKLLRHRGHRWLTIRRLDQASRDLRLASSALAEFADEVEPDGMPNALDQPVSSLHSNVWYHLALADYLRGEFESALAAAEAGMRVSTNPDRLVSQAYWLYLILRRLGRTGEAGAVLESIAPESEVIENHAYLRLLLVFKGLSSEEAMLEDGQGGIEAVTVAYGLGMRALLDGDRPSAVIWFDRAVSGQAWAAFGYLAAEAELARSES